MAPHSSTLAWTVPRMEEPGGLQAMGSQRVGHNRASSLSVSLCAHSSLQRLLLLRRTGPRAHGLPQLLLMVLAVQWRADCSWTRDRTPVPCIGRRVSNCWTTREVLFHSSLCLSNIPLYVCITSLSVNGHSSYFHALAIRTEVCLLFAQCL